MNDTISDALDTELGELMQFVDDHPEIEGDALTDELEKRFSKEAIDAFTAAFTGITPE